MREAEHGVDCQSLLCVREECTAVSGMERAREACTADLLRIQICAREDGAAADLYLFCRGRNRVQLMANGYSLGEETEAVSSLDVRELKGWMPGVS